MQPLSGVRAGLLAASQLGGLDPAEAGEGGERERRT